MNIVDFIESMEKVNQYMEDAKYHLNKASENLENKVYINIPNMSGSTSERTIDKSEAIKRMMNIKASKVYSNYKDDYGD